MSRLSFIDIQGPTSRKTAELSVKSENGTFLGEIGYQPSWKRFVFYPRDHKLFADDCLIEIAGKLAQLNKERCNEKQNGQVATPV